MEENFQFSCNTTNLQVSPSDIIKILPNWKTKITGVVGNTSMLTIKFLIAAKTREEIEQWRKAFQEQSLCTYTIKSTDSARGRYTLFRQRLRCQHKTNCSRLYDTSLKSRTRNTNCPSTMKITLRAVKSRYRGKDKNLAPDPEMPCVIELVATHNHTTNSADALRFRPVADEVKQKLIELFKNGHAPVSALEDIKMDIYLQHRDTFETMLADRKYTPDYNYCHYVYKREFYGPTDLYKDSKAFLLKYVKDFNEKSQEISVEVFGSESDYVICVCPPLMKRVHKMTKASSEIVFMNSIGAVNQQGSRVFILLTHSDCGVLPLAVIITTSENAELLSKGFQILKKMVGPDLFGGSLGGPKLFLTDDSPSQQAAIKSVWPNSECLLCIFHVLQSIWRWLIKAKHGIKQEDQYELFQDFRSIVYASSETECEQKYKEALDSAAMYPIYVAHLQNYWQRKELWALTRRANKLTRGHNTNIFSEAVMCLLKDKIFERIKAGNITHLVHFILTKFITYFEMRLLDAGHRTSRKNLFGQVIKSPPPGLIEQIQNITNNIYLVPSEKTNDIVYIVNTEVLICTCTPGNTGKICKHLNWVCFFVHSEEYNEAIDNAYIREKLCSIATGNNTAVQWLAPLFSSTHNVTTMFGINSLINTGTPSEANDKCDESLMSVDVNSEPVLRECKEIIANISYALYEHVQKSPLQLRDSLKIMQEKLNKLQTSSAVSSACANFANGKTMEKMAF